MPNPTVAAGYPKALLDFAVSKGADRQTLIERSHIRLEDLQDQDNRIPLANYMALLKAGIELCNEPALSLLLAKPLGCRTYRWLGSAWPLTTWPNAPECNCRDHFAIG